MEDEGAPPPLPSRWEVELESLSNPQYLNYLAQNKYLEKEEFLNYLEYLEYWRKPEYSQYIVYPNSLHVLTLLKQPKFRQEITRADVAKQLMDDFYIKWASGSEEPATATEEDNAKQQESQDEKIAVKQEQ